MMNPYEMMFRSGVMSEYRPQSRYASYRMTRRALKDAEPKDKSWQVFLLFAAVMIGNVVLALRWCAGL